MTRALLDLSSHWCILRTAGPRTLRLAETLGEADVEVWTPRHKYRRPVPGAKARLDGQRPTQELDGPILPTFLFARAVHQSTLEAVEQDQGNAHIASPHPRFSILRHRGAVPLISDGQIAGLRAEEAEKAALRQAMLEAESAEAAQAVRNAAMKNEAARRRADKKLEKERRARIAGGRRVKPGDQVEVEAHPAFAGMSGVVESHDGSSAWVDFGGARSFKIDAWRLALHESPALRGLAA